MRSKFVKTVACGAVALAAAAAAAEQDLVPGYLTDKSADYRLDLGAAAYETPKEHRYPYLSTYYVKPTVAPDEKVTIGYWVTDWENSLERKGDASFRFDVELKLVKREESGTTGTFKTDGRNRTFPLSQSPHLSQLSPLPPPRVLTQRDVPSADGAFDLGTLAEGNWLVGLRCIEKKSGLSSHWVWQRFRVVDPKKLAISEKETYRMTAADLKAYGLDNRGAFAREVKVDAPEFPPTLKDVNKQREFVKAFVEKYADAHPPKGSRGYTVYVPYHKNGQCLHHAFMQSAVRYDADYDKAAVWAMSERNSKGLQKLVDEKRAAGFRRLSLLPGTYRVCATNCLHVPSGLTLDLNGATLKMNEFAGCHALVVGITGPSEDAHLVGGTIETDYFEHDYKNSKNASEWVMGATIDGDCRYSSIENMNFRDITGYGLGNGLSSAWYLADPRGIAGSGRGAKFVPGTIDLKTGAVVADAARWTGDFTDISKFVPHRFVIVSKNLGYQGLATRSWYMTVGFYDKDRKFLSAEVAFQYRRLLIPNGAVYARTSIEVQSEKEANESRLCYCLHTVPWNCVIRNNRLFRCRAVGYAPAQMSNWLIEGNEFSHCGETLAACAFDAEDGWDQMQDVTIRNNDFHDNARSELLTCAGHNFIFEGNKATLCLWDRTLAPCVRGNDMTRRGYSYNPRGGSEFRCGNHNRTLHTRLGKNDWGYGVSLGCTMVTTRWDVVLHDVDIAATKEKPFTLGLAASGRVRDSKFRGIRLSNANCERCEIVDATSEMGHWDFWGVFRNCRLENVQCSAGYWHRPIALGFLDCDITVGDKPLLRYPLYALGEVGLAGGTLAFAGAKTPLVEIYDMRENTNAANPGPAQFALADLAISGTAPALIRTGGFHVVSKKPFHVWKKGVKGSEPAIPLFDAKPLPAHWKVVEN